MTADKGLSMFLYFLQNQTLPLTFSKKNPTQYVPRAENYNGKNMSKYIELKMLEIFQPHFFCSVASTVLYKVFEFLHKAGRNLRKLDCTSPNTVRGSHLSAGPEPFISLNLWQQHGFDWGQLLQGKPLHAWGLSQQAAWVKAPCCMAVRELSFLGTSHAMISLRQREHLLVHFTY